MTRWPVAGGIVSGSFSLTKTRRNRRSSICRNTIQLLRCDPSEDRSRSSDEVVLPSDPLVGDLRDGAGHGSGGRSGTGRPVRSIGSSSGPEFFDCLSGARGGGGGDEETRTPDPLLAKEMLYQLSYVPSAPAG
jgi:hypothetical protein